MYIKRCLTQRSLRPLFGAVFRSRKANLRVSFPGAFQSKMAISVTAAAAAREGERERRKEQGKREAEREAVSMGTIGKGRPRPQNFGIFVLPLVRKPTQLPILLMCLLLAQPPFPLSADVLHEWSPPSMPETKYGEVEVTIFVKNELLRGMCCGPFLPPDSGEKL